MKMRWRLPLRVAVVLAMLINLVSFCAVSYADSACEIAGELHAQPGDIMINGTRILLHSGKIPGFAGSNTSASLGGWVPRAEKTSVLHYANQGYRVWRRTKW